MNTPIADFVREYAARSPIRLHMPGHKGHEFLGCEPLDITEIPGADELYAPEGIIAESERNASSLFGTGATLYSTEGSSQCIRAMVYLAAVNARFMHTKNPYILAARNAHKTFLYALALTDTDVRWLMPERTESLCACRITAEHVARALREAEHPPIAVYITSPDYLGNILPVGEIAAVCHKAGVPLLVDNAHGAYLRFLPEDRHPITLGADMCCDSAHKTLPALTGTAYLHISDAAPPLFASCAREAMSLFGSTSPSYLMLASLDLCNRFLAEDFRGVLGARVGQVASVRDALRSAGWHVSDGEPMKLTIRAPAGTTGTGLADRLMQAGIVCEYADRDYVVLMPSVSTEESQLRRLVCALGPCPAKQTVSRADDCVSACGFPIARTAMRVRDAVFSPSELISVDEAEDRICAAPTVSCPPAIPIAVSGEVITAEHIRMFRYYGLRRVAVVRNGNK